MACRLGLELFARPHNDPVIRIGSKVHTTDLEMTVDSIQIDNAPVAEAKSGDSIGVKVSDRVRSGDLVYKITD